MFSKAFIAALLTCVFSSFATADPLTDSLDARNEKNPVAALLEGDLGCHLRSPPSAINDLQDNVGAGYAGNITIPNTLKDGQTLDLAPTFLCRVENFKFPVKTGDQDLRSVSRYIEWTDSLTASLKLTLGTWLNLLDFDGTDLQTIGIAISGGSFEYDQKKRRGALRDIIASDKDNHDCKPTLTSKKVQQVIRTCVGHITVSLESKKSLSLNAFDLKFANFSVGLKASWLREVKGTGEDCDVGGLAAPDKPAATTGDPKTGDPKTADPKTKNGFSVTIPVGSGSVKIEPAGDIQIPFPPATSDKATVTKPTDQQAAKAGPDKPATPKADQPKAQDKICAKQVVYRTGTAQILGVFLTDPAVTIKDIKDVTKN
jgi:hypothetical protein